MQTQTITCLNSTAAPKTDMARLLKLGLFLAGLGLLWIYRTPIGGLLALVKDRDGLLEILGGYGDLGLALMFALLFAQVILAAIPGHLIMVTGGYLYGFVAAFLIIQAATVSASQCAYWLARRYGRPVVERLAPPKLIETWTQRAERQGVVFFLFSFILPIFPSDVMNFVAGLSGLSFRKFLFANFLGRLPTSILFALIGAQGFSISPGLLAFAVVVTVIIFGAWRKIGPHFEQTEETGGAK